MNKPQITTVFGIYNSDDRGYNYGKPLAYYPIKAAAEAAQTHGGYQNVCPVECLRLEDTLYAHSKILDKSKIKGKLSAFVPTLVYMDYIYQDSFDKSLYYVSHQDLLELLRDGKSHNIRAQWVICDLSENYHLLLYPEPITVEKIVMSRELAVAHALSKLTDEEKKLLGL